MSYEHWAEAQGQLLFLYIWVFVWEEGILTCRIEPEILFGSILSVYSFEKGKAWFLIGVILPSWIQKHNSWNNEFPF